MVSPETAREALTAFVRGARRELAIYDAKVHDPAFQKLLNERAAKGVRIRILGGMKKADPAIEVRPLRPMRLHVRAIIRDGTRAFVGSQSLRKEELDSRREVGLLVTNPAVTRKLMQTFEADWEDSAPKRSEGVEGSEDSRRTNRRRRPLPESARHRSVRRPHRRAANGNGDDARADPPALVIQMPVDVRHVTFTLGAIVAAIWLLKNTQEVLIPFVVSGLLFYALDPFVDRLQRWRIPRMIGATVVLVSVVAGSAAIVYSLSDQMIAVVEQVPRSARLLRDQLRRPRSGERGAIEKVQQAADAIDRTAAESAAPTPAPRGVQRVQIEQPPFRATDYLWSAGPDRAGGHRLRRDDLLPHAVPAHRRRSLQAEARAPRRRVRPQEDHRADPRRDRPARSNASCWSRS